VQLELLIQKTGEGMSGDELIIIIAGLLLGYWIVNLFSWKKHPKSGGKISRSSLEEKLGIKASWSHDKIRKYILIEFEKWNGRLNSLPAGPKRDNAQLILNLLAEARKKYS